MSKPCVKCGKNKKCIRSVPKAVMQQVMAQYLPIKSISNFRQTEIESRDFSKHYGLQQILVGKKTYKWTVKELTKLLQKFVDKNRIS